MIYLQQKKMFYKMYIYFLQINVLGKINNVQEIIEYI